MNDSPGQHGKRTHVGGGAPCILSPSSAADMGKPLPAVVRRKTGLGYVPHPAIQLLIITQQLLSINKYLFAMSSGT